MLIQRKRGSQRQQCLFTEPKYFYLILSLKLIHVSKRGSCCHKVGILKKIIFINSIKSTLSCYNPVKNQRIKLSYVGLLINYLSVLLTEERDDCECLTLSPYMRNTNTLFLKPSIILFHYIVNSIFCGELAHILAHKQLGTHRCVLSKLIPWCYMYLKHQAISINTADYISIHYIGSVLYNYREQDQKITKHFKKNMPRHLRVDHLEL